MNPAPVKEPADARQANQLEWIDTLRGFAAFWVILYHSRSDLWVGFKQIQRIPGAYSTFDHAVAWLSLPISLGGSAVMLFFVISGFCIHLPYAAGKRTLKIKEYGLRRALRILPPYLFAVLLTCLLEWLVYLMGGRTPTPLHQVIRVATLTQNYDPGACQLLTNGALWSLPVEVELYIVYILGYYLVRSIGGRLTAMIVLLLSLVATVGYMRGIGNLDLNFLRFWAIWCSGALLAEWLRRGQLPKFGLWNLASAMLLLAGAVWGEARGWHLGITTQIWGAIYFHMVWFALLNPGSIHLFPKWCVRLFVWLGKVSYSAYLIHYGVFAVCEFAWVHFAGVKPANFLVPVLFSVSIWPLAWLFWKFCESPFHQLSQQLAKRVA
jgi:peptidoglycan/LPS O-acetylase OafA/YrhL